MGAKDWMLLYAVGPIAPILQAAPALFGFNYEGGCRDTDPDLERVALAGYEVGSRRFT